MKKYFLVYEDGTHTDHVVKLIESVKNYSDFEVVTFYKSNISEEFIIENNDILNSPRGGGYWLWKPYIINNLLSKINDGDFLFYLDSKYYFTESFTELYNEPIQNTDILVWNNKPNETTNQFKFYCKPDVIHKYNMEDYAYNQNINEFWAGAIFIKKTTNSVSIMNEWLEMCCNYSDITDSPSISSNPYFRDHRHDQSLLTIVLYKNNINKHFFEKKYLQNVRIPY